MGFFQDLRGKDDSTARPTGVNIDLPSFSCPVTQSLLSRSTIAVKVAANGSARALNWDK
jgi:hypothetical protein